MNKVSFNILLIFTIIFFCNFTNVSVVPGNVLDEIINAIKKGNSNELAKHFSNTIDLTIPGNEGTYSKNQAEMIMKDFFNKYASVSFNINNKGSSKQESQFAIGELKTNKGNFRTFFMLKEQSGKYYLQQLKIEKQ